MLRMRLVCGGAGQESRSFGFAQDDRVFWATCRKFVRGLWRGQESRSFGFAQDDMVFSRTGRFVTGPGLLR